MTRSFIRHRILTAVTAGIMAAAGVQEAAAQASANRYLFFLRDVTDPANRPQLIAKVTASGGQIVGDVFYPELGFIGVVGVFPQGVAVESDPVVEVVRDVLVYTQSGPLGTAWVRNQFQQPAPALACNDTPPVVYVIDTGITSTHPDFVYPVSSPPTLTFAPGFSYAKNTTTGALLPEYPDNHDHGTRIAGCLGGLQTGLLGPLGGRAVVKSVAIFDTPQTGNLLATFASQAINGILRATTDHKARKALPYLKSRASVLVFAHATRLVDGRFSALDSAIEKAWQAGMHVVMSAGNEGVNAALVSPAGAAWGYTMPGPIITRFWSGALPGGATLYQAAPEFTVAGGYDLVGGLPQLWAQTNRNIGAATAVDGFAPAVNVPCAAAVGPPYNFGNGTSYSAGLTAAMLTWEAWMRPWATPDMARTWLNNSMTTQPGGWKKVETPALPAAGLTWAEWIEAFYPLAVSTAAQRDPAGDPDGDGTQNFVEYFMGRDPRFADSASMEPCLLLNKVSGSYRLTVRLPVACHLPSPAQVTWRLEESSNLTTWTGVAAGALNLVSPTTILGDGVLRESVTVVPSTTRRLYRVKFTWTP